MKVMVVTLFLALFSIATIEYSMANETIPSGQIVFASHRDGDYEIYRMNVDGSNLLQLTDNEYPDLRPEWSPDGTQILFVSARYDSYELVEAPASDYEIYIMNADGSDVRQLTTNDEIDLGATWSPDGRQIAFHSSRDGDFEIYIMTLDGIEVRQITNNSISDGSPSWSPDGTQIAFVSRRTGDNTIYVMDVDGSNLQQLTDEEISSDRPVWSPDGTQIAYFSLRDGEYQIMTMNNDGSNVRQLTTNVTQRGTMPAWSPDGNHIIFQCRLRDQQRDGHEYYDSELCLIERDGSNLRELTENESEDIWPDWTPLSDDE